MYIIVLDKIKSTNTLNLKVSIPAQYIHTNPYTTFFFVCLVTLNFFFAYSVLPCTIRDGKVHIILATGVNK